MIEGSNSLDLPALSPEKGSLVISELLMCIGGSSTDDLGILSLSESDAQSYNGWLVTRMISCHGCKKKKNAPWLYSRPRPPNQTLQIYNCEELQALLLHWSQQEPSRPRSRQCVEGFRGC